MKIIIHTYRIFFQAGLLLALLFVFANGMAVLVNYHVAPEIENPLLNNFMYLCNGGVVDSNPFSTSPITLVFPIVLILICIAPTIINYLYTKKI